MTTNQKTILTCLEMLLANAKSKAHEKQVKQQIADFKRSCEPKKKTMPDWVDKF